MNFSREDYINYRIKRAEEAFEEAVLLAKLNRWNTVINRLYYSMFYIISALLLKNGVNPSTHDGVKNQFGLHFIKTGIINKEMGTLYSLLFDYRHKGDYGDMFDFDEEIALPLIHEVREFIIEIKKLLDTGIQ